MPYSVGFRTKVIRFRKKGWSFREISKQFHISKSTASVWLHDIELPTIAMLRLKKRKIFGQEKTRQIALMKRKLVTQKALEDAYKTIKKVNVNRETAKLSCALLYWAEGSKVDKEVSFINSDSKMIRCFIKLLKIAFNIDNRKFRALIHIHEYHDENSLKEYWSKITDIPLAQFTKSYLKPHTGISKKPGYMGSINISYYDVKIARELHALYNVFATKIGS